MKISLRPAIVLLLTLFLTWPAQAPAAGSGTPQKTQSTLAEIFPFQESQSPLKPLGGGAIYTPIPNASYAVENGNVVASFLVGPIERDFTALRWSESQIRAGFPKSTRAGFRLQMTKGLKRWVLLENASPQITIVPIGGTSQSMAQFKVIYTYPYSDAPDAVVLNLTLTARDEFGLNQTIVIQSTAYSYGSNESYIY